MPRDRSDAMLQRLIDEAKRALSIQDPAGRAEVISSSLQPYTGWALRWAIEDCRNRGMTWQTIAGMLSRSYPALLRQYEAGGPIYTVSPAQSPSSGNFDGQTPLRRAAKKLGEQMAGLWNVRRDGMTYTHLNEQVETLTNALGNTDDPALMLRAAFEVTAMARQIRLSVTSQRMSKEERETWNTIDELIACYDRDHKEIEVADQVLSAVGELQRPLANVPGFTRPLRPRAQ